MASDFMASAKKDGLSVVLYRGEDLVLLAFDIEKNLQTADFVGFGIQYRVGDKPEVSEVYNGLTFKAQRLQVEDLAKQIDAAKSDADKKALIAKRLDIIRSTRSPLQMFRWAHVPSKPIDGNVTYIVSAMFANGDQPPVAKAKVEATINIGAATRGNFLNVGFTRGFATSQAYARKFHNNPKVLPDKGKDEIAFDMSPFEGPDQPYEWLGFEARRLMVSFLDDCVKDKTISVDAFAYDFSNPEIVTRLEALGNRLRIIIDDSGTHGKPKSEEALGEKRLVASAGRQNVARHHFSGLQHNKIFIAKRGGKAFKVLTGSTNFALRGLYIQNNNVLVFQDDGIAKFYADAFAAGFPKPDGFNKKDIAKDWFKKETEFGPYRFCFSPHAKAELSMGPLADAIKAAKSSVLYAIAFRGAETGPAAIALDELPIDKIHVMGVADKPGDGKPRKGKKGNDLPPLESKTTMVQLPGRGKIPLSPAALKDKLPEPFHAEWPGGSGVRMHHKFVICDFNGPNPVAYTGSSNLASGGEEGNGDNLFEIRDPKVVVAYAVQAVSIFDHYAFRVRMKDAKDRPAAIDLAEAVANVKDAWWQKSFGGDKGKTADRKLFAMSDA
ncbi:MAG: hypothetical protein QOF22_521 [Bradyrhizobium sp.]|nr:hypothetical protein [Bradyrhizobium sp.]